MTIKYIWRTAYKTNIVKQQSRYPCWYLPNGYVINQMNEALLQPSEFIFLLLDFYYGLLFSLDLTKQLWEIWSFKIVSLLYRA